MYFLLRSHIKKTFSFFSQTVHKMNINYSQGILLLESGRVFVILIKFETMRRDIDIARQIALRHENPVFNIYGTIAQIF